MNQQIFDTVMKFISSWFTKTPEVQIQIPIDPTSPEAPKPEAPVIDWNDPECLVTPHFKVKDALMQHAWNKLATVVDGADYARLTALCQKMEEVRNALGCPINVHCMYRSAAYNESQNIKPAADVHSMNLACDFDCNGHLTIDQVKAKLEPLLEGMGIRMERGTTTWVHIDLRQPGPSGRYFTA